MESDYSFQMGAQVPSALFPMQQGFVLGEFPDEDNMDLAMMESSMDEFPMDELPMDEAPLDGISMDYPSMNHLPIFQTHDRGDPWEATTLAYRSREPSVLVPQSSKHPKTEDWNRIKPIFTKLYSKENKTLRKVQEILEGEHGFSATERMYKARIKEWNLHKNLNDARRVTLVGKLLRTGKADGLLLNDRSVQRRLARYCKEKNVLPEDLVTSVPHRRHRHSPCPVRVNDHTESAQHRLQSLFRSRDVPLRPIALYGDLRSAEVILWNMEEYLNSYLTTGPGTWYFRKGTTVTVQNGLSGQSLVLVSNEALKDTVNPSKMYTHIWEALIALGSGFVDSAFKSVGKANALIKVIFEQQHPTFSAYLFTILTDLTGNTSSLAQKTLQHILDMATTVFKSSHPITTIINKFCALSSAGDKCFVWRGVTDALDRSFAVLEDSEMRKGMRRQYFEGLRELGQLNEAETYLDVLYSKDGRAQYEMAQYICEKAIFLFKQGRYMEAEIQYRRILGLVEEIENEVFSNATSSRSSLSPFEAHLSLYFLALALECLGRIDEAKAMYWRAFKLIFAEWGADDVDTEITGSDLDDFLTRHGFVEESTALKAQYPRLLRRQKLSPEDL